MRLTLTIVPLVLLLVTGSCRSFTTPASIKTSKVSMYAIPETILGVQAIQAGAAAAVAAIGGVVLKLKKGKSSSNNIKEIDSPKSLDAVAVAVDIAIPYDAAATLAYDEWRSVNGKEIFDQAGFVVFKDLYNSKSVAEVTLKKCERDLASLKNGKAEDTAGNSVRYDAAARLAYDEWRNTNNKGEFDEEGYAGFKPIYTSKSVADASYKKITREIASL